jgi:hypothetical protein
MLTTALDRWLYAFKDPLLANGRIPTTKHIDHLSAVVGTGSDTVPGLVEFYRELNVDNVEGDVWRECSTAIEVYTRALDDAELRGSRIAMIQIVRTMMAMSNQSDDVIHMVTKVPMEIISIVRTGSDDEAPLQAWVVSKVQLQGGK